MKRRKGFISIMALITMTILITMSLYLVYLSVTEYSIISSNLDKTQSYYQSEGKIHLALYDDQYYLNQLHLDILEVFRTNSFNLTSKKVRLKPEDLNYGDDIKDLSIRFIDENDRLNMSIISESNANGMETKLVSKGTIVNRLFEMDYPILALNLIDEEYRDELDDLLKIIKDNISIDNCHRPGSIYGKESRDYSKLTLKGSGNRNHEISSRREGMVNPHVEGFSQKEVFIIAKPGMDKNVELIIDNVDLSGIIYVEGDIIISSSSYFKGIIIVKNGKIVTNTRNKSTIYGLVIMDNMENYDDFIQGNKLTRNRRMINRYGTYLPGFLDLKLELIKGI